MKILVTGGTGRIGSNLVKKMLEKGHDIRNFVYPGDVNRVGRWDDGTCRDCSWRPTGIRRCQKSR